MATNPYYNNSKEDGDLLLASTLEAIEAGFDLYEPLILNQSNNLSDVANLTTTQDNLGLKAAAYLERDGTTGGTPGTVARGFHTHSNITTPLVGERDGFGLDDRCTARQNIAPDLPGQDIFCGTGGGAEPGLAFFDRDDYNEIFWPVLEGVHEHTQDLKLIFDTDPWAVFIGFDRDPYYILRWCAANILNYYSGVYNYPNPI